MTVIIVRFKGLSTGGCALPPLICHASVPNTSSKTLVAYARKSSVNILNQQFTYRFLALIQGSMSPAVPPTLVVIWVRSLHRFLIHSWLIFATVDIERMYSLLGLSLKKFKQRRTPHSYLFFFGTILNSVDYDGQMWKLFTHLQLSILLSPGGVVGHFSHTITTVV